MLLNNYNINKIKNNYDTGLHEAINLNNYSILNFLLINNMNINIIGKNGNNPLFNAIN